MLGLNLLLIEIIHYQTWSRTIYLNKVKVTVSKLWEIGAIENEIEIDLFVGSSVLKSVSISFSIAPISHSLETVYNILFLTRSDNEFN